MGTSGAPPFLDFDLSLEERRQLAIKALYEKKSNEERRRLAIQFDAALMEQVFQSSEFSELLPAFQHRPSDELEVVSPPRKSAQLDLVDGVREPLLEASMPAHDKQSVKTTSFDETTATPAKTLKDEKGRAPQTLEERAQYLKDKYNDFKMINQDASGKMVYSFSYRDCKYSGKVDKNGSGRIQVVNRGDWTQKDVDDLVNHIANDIGSRNVKISEKAVYPASMLLVACKALQAKGIKVTITNGTILKSVDDFRASLEESLKEIPNAFKFSELPIEVQEFKKESRINLHSQRKKLSTIQGKISALGTPPTPDKTEELSRTFAEGDVTTQQMIKLAHEELQYLEARVQAHQLAPDHPCIKAAQHQLTKLEALRSKRDVKIGKIEEEYREKKEQLVAQQAVEIKKFAHALQDQGYILVDVADPANEKYSFLSEQQRAEFEKIGEELVKLGEQINSNPKVVFELTVNLSNTLDEFLDSPSIAELKKHEDMQGFFKTLGQLQVNCHAEKQRMGKLPGKPPDAVETRTFQQRKSQMQQAIRPDAFCELSSKEISDVQRLLKLIHSLSSEDTSIALLIEEIKGLANKLQISIDGSTDPDKITAKLNVRDFEALKGKLNELEQKDPEATCLDEVIIELENIEFNLNQSPHLKLSS